MLIDVSGDQPNERSSSLSQAIKEKLLQEKILEDISRLRIGYHKREGMELEKVPDHVAVDIDPLAVNSFSLGTTARRNTSPGHMSMNIDMGDGRRRDQEPKMKEFRTFAYVTVPLFITIQVGLLSANKRQPEVLFTSCGGLVTGATICSIGMLVLVLMCPSSQRALIFLKMLQLLIIGLLLVAAILIFTLL